MSEPVSDDQQLVDLLEWLAAECDVAFDRVVARRAIQEARQGWPGSEEEQWWKWLIEAGDSMGLRVRVVELTFQQALETVPDSFNGYDQRIEALRERILSLLPAIHEARNSASQEIYQLAMQELGARRERLISYRAQARYALARSYDQLAGQSLTDAQP